MRVLPSTIKHLLLVPVFAVLVLLGGCEGVHVEGPGFELGGKKNNVDKKVPDRAPLLIPPDRVRLPAPQQAIASTPPQNWPTDPGDIQKAEAIAAAKKKKEYEDSGDWSKKADIDEFEKVMDPIERKPGILSKNKKLDDQYRDFREYHDCTDPDCQKN